MRTPTDPDTQVVFTTLPEFLPTAHRGAYMVLLASGWMWGSIYSASVGWVVIPTSVSRGGGWRSFVVASAIPSILCLVGVVAFMPESPRHGESSMPLTHSHSLSLAHTHTHTGAYLVCLN